MWGERFIPRPPITEVQRTTLPPWEIEIPAAVQTWEEVEEFLTRVRPNPFLDRDPEVLAQLRKFNSQALKVGEAYFAQKLKAPAPGTFAILVPAHHEQDTIGPFLTQLLRQVRQIGRASELGWRRNTPIPPLQVIIIINGEGEIEKNSPTVQALEQWKRENPALLSELEEMDIVLTYYFYPPPGKVNSLHRAILDLNQSGSHFPDGILSLDADSPLLSGGLSIIHNALLDPRCRERKNIVAARVALPEHSENLRAVLAELPLRGHGERLGWAQGGAWAIPAGLVPFYLSYSRLLPGLYTDDVGFSLACSQRGGGVVFTQRPILPLPPPTSWAGFLRQVNRWLGGTRQLEALAEAELIDAVVQPQLGPRFLQRVQDFFPQTLAEAREKLTALIRQGGRELVGLPLFAALFWLIDHEHSLVLKVEGQEVELGGPLPNIYRPIFWQPPR